jgi:GNAT superfamily N-acetyltransferase
VTIDVLPDAPASVQGLHVLCGEKVAVRPARPQDTGMIGAYIRALSFASRRNRFLGSVNEMSANELYRMTHGDDVARPALIVEAVDGVAHVMIGEARYALLPDGLSCEFALSVAEACRHKGIGTLLIGIIEDRQGSGHALSRRRCLPLERSDGSAGPQRWICRCATRIGRQIGQDHKGSFCPGRRSGSERDSLAGLVDRSLTEQSRKAADFSGVGFLPGRHLHACP